MPSIWGHHPLELTYVVRKIFPSEKVFYMEKFMNFLTSSAIDYGQSARVPKVVDNFHSRMCKSCVGGRLKTRWLSAHTRTRIDDIKSSYRDSAATGQVMPVVSTPVEITTRNYSNSIIIWPNNSFRASTRP